MQVVLQVPASSSSLQVLCKVSAYKFSASSLQVFVPSNLSFPSSAREVPQVPQVPSNALSSAPSLASSAPQALKCPLKWSFTGLKCPSSALKCPLKWSFTGRKCSLKCAFTGSSAPEVPSSAVIVLEVIVVKIATIAMIVILAIVIIVIVITVRIVK